MFVEKQLGVWNTSSVCIVCISYISIQGLQFVAYLHWKIWNPTNIFGVPSKSETHLWCATETLNKFVAPYCNSKQICGVPLKSYTNVWRKPSPSRARIRQNIIQSSDPSHREPGSGGKRYNPRPHHREPGNPKLNLQNSQLCLWLAPCGNNYIYFRQLFGISRNN